MHRPCISAFIISGARCRWACHRRAIKRQILRTLLPLSPERLIFGAMFRLADAIASGRSHFRLDAFSYSLRSKMIIGCRHSVVAQSRRVKFATGRLPAYDVRFKAYALID